VLLGFQSLEQIIDTYGEHLGRVILEQAATVVYLRTKGATSSKWIEDSIGKEKTMRVSEGRTTGTNGHHNHNVVIEEKALIMASEISGLPKMHGYLQVEDLVTPIRFPAIAVPKRCLAFIERPHTTKPARARVETASGPEALEGPALPPVNPQNEFSFLG
jgi:hypothetical protein